MSELGKKYLDFVKTDSFKKIYDNTEGLNKEIRTQLGSDFLNLDRFNKSSIQSYVEQYNTVSNDKINIEEIYSKDTNATETTKNIQKQIKKENKCFIKYCEDLIDEENDEENDEEFVEFDYDSWEEEKKINQMEEREEEEEEEEEEEQEKEQEEEMEQESGMEEEMEISEKKNISDIFPEDSYDDSDFEEEGMKVGHMTIEKLKKEEINYDDDEINIDEYFNIASEEKENKTKNFSIIVENFKNKTKIEVDLDQKKELLGEYAEFF